MVLSLPKAPELAPDTTLPVPMAIVLSARAWEFSPIAMARSVDLSLDPVIAPLPIAIEFCALAVAPLTANELSPIA